MTMKDFSVILDVKNVRVSFYFSLVSPHMISVRCQRITITGIAPTVVRNILPQVHLMHYHSLNFSLYRSAYLNIYYNYNLNNFSPLLTGFGPTNLRIWLRSTDAKIFYCLENLL